MHDHGAVLRRQPRERRERLVAGRPARLGAGTVSTSSTSPRSLRARVQSIARLTTMRCSHGPNGRRRSKRSSDADRREERLLGDVLGSCRVVGDEVGGPKCARPVHPEQRLEIRDRPSCAPRTRARSSRPARIRCPDYDGTRPRGPCPRYERGGREVHGTSDAPRQAYTSMDRREFLVSAAPRSLALASTRRARARRLGGTGGRARHRGPREPRRRARLALGRRSCSDPDRARPAEHRARRRAERASSRTRSPALVTLIDAAERAFRAELDGFEAPRYTAVHPNADDRLRHRLGAPRRSSTVDAVRGASSPAHACPGPARHVSVSLDGGRSGRRSDRRPNRIAVLDLAIPRRPRLVRTFAPPFLAHDVVFAPDGHVWVTSGAGRRDRRLSAGSRASRASLAAGPPAARRVRRRARPSSRAATTAPFAVHRLDGPLVRRGARSRRLVQRLLRLAGAS